jgi:hypothetical protein
MVIVGDRPSRAFTIAPRGAPGPDPASSVTFLNIHAIRPAAADNAFGILLIRASAYLCVEQILWTANGCTNTISVQITQPFLILDA